METMPIIPGYGADNLLRIETAVDDSVLESVMNVIR